MCGIAGFFVQDNAKDNYPIDLKEMCRVISHRGPDDEGIYLNATKSAGLGHRRLSIIDLSSGHQPMSDSKENLWIVFNGEIYNFPELKKDLLDKGHTFRTKSDTEVIIILYREYGDKCFEMLNGIFALAIYDSEKQSIILARDQFGVKPLYYAVKDGRLLFASEIKSILSAKIIDRKINYSSLNTFLTLRYNPSPQTLFIGIYKLEPGHCLSVDSGGNMIKKNYSSYKPNREEFITEKDAIEKYQVLLEQAIKRQMLSDVPIGLLLSGGLDSALIGKIMSDNSKEIIKTFSIGFNGNGDFNELDDARRNSDFLKSEHFEMLLTRAEYMKFYLESFYFVEEPISETTIPALYYITKLASPHLKVLLTGQGADEPLAGYQRYYGENLLNKYSKFFNLTIAKFLVNIIPRNERLKRFISAANFNNELERFLKIYTIFTPSEKEKLFKDSFKELNDETTLNIIRPLYDNCNNMTDPLNKLIYIDTRLSLSDDLLLFGDKISMSNSIEMRVPFLDFDLVRFLETLPSNFKLKGKNHKYIHKKAAIKWVPQNIINRKKRGFSTPMDSWMQSELIPFMKDILLNDNSFIMQILNKHEVEKLISNHASKKQNNTRKLFCLMSLEVWHKNFFENSNLEKNYNYFHNIDF